MHTQLAFVTNGKKYSWRKNWTGRSPADPTGSVGYEYTINGVSICRENENSGRRKKPEYRAGSLLDSTCLAHSEPESNVASLNFIALGRFHPSRST